MGSFHQFANISYVAQKPPAVAISLIVWTEKEKHEKIKNKYQEYEEILM